VCAFTHTHTHTLSLSLSLSRTRAQDANGTSDPYCVLAVGNHKPVRSCVQYKTCNPVFKEIFEFEDPAHTETLSVRVFDSDVFSGTRMHIIS
jgi:Ca2+-dependent lipid-binding protein